MYDDEVQVPISLTASDRYYKCAKFPTRNIRSPVILLFGGSDSLVDIDVMLKELPPHTLAKEVPSYEHLDFLWASSVDSLVFPTIFESLQRYARDEESTLGYHQSDRSNQVQGGGLLQRPAQRELIGPSNAHTDGLHLSWKRRNHPQSSLESRDLREEDAIRTKFDLVPSDGGEEGSKNGHRFLDTNHKHIDTDESYLGLEDSAALKS